MEQVKAFLLMDDSRERDDLVDILYRQNYQVSITEHTDAVATLISQLKPDAIFLDLDMVGDGIEVLKFLRRCQTDDDTLFFVFSSKDDPSLVIKALAVGATDFIRLPYVKAELTLRLRARLKARKNSRDLVQQRESLSSFFSPQIVEGITTGRIEAKVGGHMTNATVMFIKVTQLCAVTGMVPSQMAELMSRAYSTINNVVSEFGGTMISSRGDTFVIGFGIPKPIPRKESVAIAAAQQIVQEISDIQKEWADATLSDGLGIAVTSGSVYAGNIGSKKRLEYTILGSPVTKAEQLQEFAMNLGVPVIVDAQTSEACEQVLPKISVKHSNQSIYTLEAASKANNTRPSPILFNRAIEPVAL